MGWAALSARNESVAAFAAELPARAPASSPEAVAALADGAAGAAQELEALADAAEVAGEAAPPGLTAALAAVALPPCLLDKGMLSQHHPGLRGQVDVFAAAWDLVEDAAEGRRRLADVRPGVVLRLAPPGTPAAQQLQRQCHEWLHGTEHHPVPQALHQQRSQQLQAFSNAMAASAAAATNPHTATLLRFAAQGWAYFEPLSCRPALRALLRTFAPVADIRIDCCLGPATSLPAVSLACVLATGGMHIERNEQAGLAELFSVLAGLCSAGSLQHLRPLLKGVTVCYSLSNKALEPFTDPITGDEVIRISQEKAKHGTTTGSGATLCGLTNLGFTTIALTMLSPATVSVLGLGTRTSSTELTLTAGADVVTMVAQLARTLVGEHAAVYAKMAELFDTSRQLCGQVLQNRSPLKVIHDLFHGLSLPPAAKLDLVSLLTDESTAVRFRLDGAAKDVRLLQLRALQLYGLRDALPLLPSASLVDALPGGAAEWDAAREEVLGGLRLSLSAWEYTEEQWQMVESLPPRYRTAEEMLLVDMQGCERPRCYLLEALLQEAHSGYSPTQKTPTEEAATSARERLAAILLTRCITILVDDLVQAAPDDASAAAALASPATSAAFHAMDGAARGWMPDHDLYVGSRTVHGMQHLCVDAATICALPSEPADHPSWKKALKIQWVMRALSVRGGTAEEVKAGQRPAGGAAPHGAAAAANAAGGAPAAAHGGHGDANAHQPVLVDVGPRIQAALHNAMETAVAQVLAMKGSEGGHQLAARIMAILGKYLAPVLETGRVPEAAMLEEFRDVLPPGAPLQLAVERLARLSPTAMDVYMSQATEQPAGSAAWVAATDGQVQQALQAHQRTGTMTAAGMMAAAAEGAAAGAARQAGAGAARVGQAPPEQGAQEAPQEEQDEEEEQQQQQPAGQAAQQAEQAEHSEAGQAAQHAQQQQAQQAQQQQGAEGEGELDGEQRASPKQEPSQQRSLEQRQASGGEGSSDVSERPAGRRRRREIESGEAGPSGSSDENETSQGPPKQPRIAPAAAGNGGGGGGSTRPVLHPVHPGQRLTYAVPGRGSFKGPRPAGGAGATSSSGLGRGSGKAPTLGLAHRR